MKISRYDQAEVTESPYRLGVAALIWAALLGYFALAERAHDEPKQMVQAAPSVANETGRTPAVVVNAPNVGDPETRDAAAVAHEEPDSADVGLSSDATR